MVVMLGLRYGAGADDRRDDVMVMMMVMMSLHDDGGDDDRGDDNNDMPFASSIVNKTSFCLILVLLLPTGS